MKFTSGILLVVTLTVQFSFAQNAVRPETENNFRAVHWTLYEGLTNAVTNGIIKDVNGFIWISTNNGLNRFDGSLVKKYYHDPYNTQTITGNYIGALVEDSLHNIWIGTDRGMSRYDIKADSFVNFLISNLKAEDLSILPFSASRNEVFAVESGSIISYNIRSFQKNILAKITPADSVGEGLSFLYAIYDSATNSVWMLRSSQYSTSPGLLNFSLSDEKKIFYKWEPPGKCAPSNSFAEAMCYDRKRNCIWINSADGLLEFSLDSRRFHRPGVMEELASRKGYARFVGIDLDQRGRVWIATAPKGILIYDPLDSTVNMPMEDSAMQKDVSHDNSVLYCDRDGIIWSGFWLPKGIWQMTPFSPAVRLFKPNPESNDSYQENAVICFDADSAGKIRLTTIGPTFIFDTYTSKLERSKAKFSGIVENQFNRTIVLDPVRNKSLHFTGDGKFYALDLKTGKARKIIFMDSLNRPIHSIDNFFSWRFKNNFITHVKFNNHEYIFGGNWDSANAREVIKIEGSTNWIFTAFADERMLFLKRGEDLGNLTYSYIDGSWKRTPNPVDSLQWTSIFYHDKDQSYWVAHDRKLTHYDKNFKVIRLFGQDDGLPDMNIVGLIADNNGNIWFHSDRSIHQLNVETGEISTLSGKDGFEKQDFELIPFNFKDDQGQIYFPGGGPGKGFDRINPKKYTNPTSTVYLQSILVNQKQIALTSGTNNLEQLDLGYSENTISIETGIIDFYSGGNSHMRYKLETDGADAVWQYAPANYTIRFQDLQPGRYTLHMQASNAALQFNGPEKVLEIIIRPPWWQTWWARSLFILAIAFSLWGFIQYRSRNLKERNTELEDKVVHRTKELKHSLEDLRATQTQLIQREKLASLGELTAGIAHEIQNPLNFVNNFSELNKELLAEMNEEIQNGNYPEVKAIARSLTDNEEKINHHGKRADAIVKGMLQHSRSGSSIKEPTDINTLADEYLRLSYHGLRAREKSFNATMNTDIDASIGLININPQDIGRVLLNLYNNAFYAVNEKRVGGTAGYEPTVSVSTHKTDNKIEIRVKDNGNGIPQKVLDKIFQPFFTTKPTGQGTGLGLSLSYDIVKAHGGEIRVNMKEGEFTEFIVQIPAM